MQINIRDFSVYHTQCFDDHEEANALFIHRNSGMYQKRVLMNVVLMFW